jgi:hypothetical protein
MKYEKPLQATRVPFHTSNASYVWSFEDSGIQSFATLSVRQEFVIGVGACTYEGSSAGCFVSLDFDRWASSHWSISHSMWSTDSLA